MNKQHTQRRKSYILCIEEKLVWIIDANCGMWRKEAAKPTLRERDGRREGGRNAKERESIRSNYAVHYPFPIDRVPRARCVRR